MQSKKIAIVGFGKIAKEQHFPSIAEIAGLELVATVSRRGEAPAGIPSFPSIDALAAGDIAIDAAALCMPPEGRSEMARSCADHGWDILLEKPPGISVEEVRQLHADVSKAGRILFTTWHSQYNAAVDAAAQRLASQDIVSMHIDWREDVRKWHPGQDWIWDEGGFGVFDPGINGLSIATKIMPNPFSVKHARLTIASNHRSPIAAEIQFTDQISAHFDWREPSGECWKITVRTTLETLVLDKGGSELWVDGQLKIAAPSQEYRHIYARFLKLMQARESHVDLAPLELVEQAFRIGEICQTEPFQS